MPVHNIPQETAQLQCRDVVVPRVLQARAMFTISESPLTCRRARCARSYKCQAQGVRSNQKYDHVCKLRASQALYESRRR
eukprot:6208534-Pleurochrysis_carterae.AAC.2